MKKSGGCSSVAIISTMLQFLAWRGDKIRDGGCGRHTRRGGYWLQYGDGERCRLGVRMYASFNGSLGSGCDEQRVAVVQVHLLDACDDALLRTLIAGSVGQQALQQ